MNSTTTHFNVIARRNNTVVHMQDAATRAEAERLKARFESVANTEAEIVEVHDRSETDLTAHTRDLVEQKLQERTSGAHPD